MNLLVKTLRNWLVANLCALLPLLWLAFGWMPDQVLVRYRGNTPHPVAILADGVVLQGEAYGLWPEGIVWRFYLKQDMSWRNLSYLLRTEAGTESIQRIDLQKWKLLCMGKPGSGLEPSPGMENAWRFANPGFDCLFFASRRAAAGMLFLEACLLAMSRLFARHHGNGQRKSSWTASALVALALTVLMHVALPLQSYLGNASAYPFSLGTLGGVLAVRFAWILALATLAIGLLSRCFGRWVLGAVLAFAVCVYLESGILSAGLPDLNGDWWFFQNRTRALWDASVWVGVFMLAAALHPLLKRHYGLAGGCLLAMTVASMFDVKQEGKADTSMLVVHDFSPIETVIRSVTYSSSRNVMVFVLDTLEREQAHAIMEDPEAGPELRPKFRGFTEYADNVGAGSNSLLGVANLFTGEYPENAGYLFDYFASPYSGQSALRGYLEREADVYMATASLGYGYCNRPVPPGTETEGTARSCLDIPGQEGQGWTLAGMTRFRWLPFAAKAPYAFLMEQSTPEPDFNLHEWVVYPVLQKAEVNRSNRETFLFVHTRGVHGPVLYNRRGERLPQADPSEEARREIGIWAMRQLASLFDSFREKGIYDNSMIVVLADHGRQGAHQHSPDWLPANGRPFLWIKPMGSRHEFESSSLPTCHAKVADLLREAAGRDLDQQEIESIICSSRRKYRNLHGGVGPEWEDWIVHGDGRVEHTSGRLQPGDAKTMLPLAPARHYSLDKESMVKNKTNVEFHNTMFWDTPTLLAENPSVEFAFRVPEPGRRYTLHMTLKYTNAGNEDEAGTCMKFRQANRDGEWQRSPVDYHVAFALHGLEPDRDGLVKIEGAREPGFRSRVHFTHLMLEEEH